MKIHLAIAAFSLPLLLGVAGCKQNVSPDTYSVGGVGQVNRVVRGTVISARPVNIQGNRSGVGAGVGAAGGAVGGSAIGGDTRSNILGALGGAVIGGIVGAAVEEGSTAQNGMEYVIQAENGALLTVVQGVEPAIKDGARVLVLYGGQSRVILDTSAPR